MTKRFDRRDGGEKLHVQTLGGLAHLDFNAAGANSYEQAFLIMRQLELGMKDVEQLFRRMAFNVIARNQDDHVKNIAFLMDKRGQWSLAPAYDVCYSYNPTGLWTASHQMTINGKRDGFSRADLSACGAIAMLKPRRANTLIDEVRAAVEQWPEYAYRARVSPAEIETIYRHLRLQI
jgi:serine/threonine-protein kinase HipA